MVERAISTIFGRLEGKCNEQRGIHKCSEENDVTYHRDTPWSGNNRFVFCTIYTYIVCNVHFFNSEIICGAGQVCFYHTRRERIVKQQDLSGSFGEVFWPAKGRSHENPSVAEFVKNTQALRVINSTCSGIKGNCRGNNDVNAKKRPLVENARLLFKRRKTH